VSTNFLERQVAEEISTGFAHPAAGEAHLFCVAFTEFGRWDFAWDILSVDERARAAAFIAGSVRDRYVFSHAFLRSVLSAFLRQAPSQIALERLPGGKPVLVSAANHALWFNLSHCMTHVVVAVAGTPDVGVDVECARDALDALGIARRFFAPAEVSRLTAVAPGLVEDTFLRLWTCKEAFLKAIGVGLGFGLDSISISESGGNDVTFAEIPSGHGSPEAWSLRTFAPASGCQVALAVNVPRVRVTEHWY
jgi:4'-phosphopantetheinyl transferase